MDGQIDIVTPWAPEGANKAEDRDALLSNKAAAILLQSAEEVKLNRCKLLQSTACDGRMLCFTIPGLTFPMCFASRFRLIVLDICTLNNLCEDSAMSGVSEPTASVSEGCYTRDLALCIISTVPTPTPPAGQSAAKLQSVLQYLLKQTTLILQYFCSYV